jgi:hypothetical protein
VRHRLCGEPILQQRHLRDAVTSLLVALVVGGGPMTLEPSQPYVAVTLAPKERMTFLVPALETVTGSTGRCLVEGVATNEVHATPAIFVEASCSGVRTSIVWRKDKKRIALRACAEDEFATTVQKQLRKQVQTALKDLKSVTACVYNGHVELWGWAKDEATLKRVQAMESKYGYERVQNKVETLDAP